MNIITKDMHDITRCQAQYRASYMEPFELRGPHANYLMALCTEPGISQEQLGRQIYANKSNIARQVSVLEEKGYVYRECDAKDKRILHVYPTEKAKELLPLILKKQEEWDNFITKNLTEEELAQARTILQRMKHQADAFMERES